MKTFKYVLIYFVFMLRKYGFFLTLLIPDDDFFKIKIHVLNTLIFQATYFFI